MALTAALLASSHCYPGQAYPLQGLFNGIGLCLLMPLAAGVLFLARQNPPPNLSATKTGKSSPLPPPQAPSIFPPELALPAGLLLTFTAWAWIRTALSSTPDEGNETVTMFLLGLPAFWLGALLTSGSQSLAQARRALFLLGMLAVAFALHAAAEYHFLYAAKLAKLRQDPAFNPDEMMFEGLAFALQARRVSSVFGNPNVFAAFLAMSVPILAAFFWEASGPSRVWKRLTLTAAILVICYAACRTRSAGGLIILALGIALSIAACLWARKSALLSTTAALLAAACVLFLTGAAETPSTSAPPTSSALVTSPPPDGAKALTAAAPAPRQARTLQQRYYYLVSGLAMWRQAPFFGQGLGAYMRLYPQMRLPGAGETRYAHNSAMQLAVETGLLGLALFTVFLLAVYGRALRAILGTSPSVRTTRPWLLAAMAAAILYLIDTLGDYSFYVRELYTDFCLLSGLVIGLTLPPSTPEKPRPAPRAPRFHATPLLFGLTILFTLAGVSAWIVPTQMAEHYKMLAHDALDELAAVSKTRPALAREALLDAREASSEALRWRPGSPWLWQLHARVMRYSGESERARRELEKAAALHPLSSQICSELAQFEWESGNRAEASRWIDRAIALYPLKSNYRVIRARFFKQSGRHEQAVTDSREAIRIAFTPLEQKESAQLLSELLENH